MLRLSRPLLYAAARSHYDVLGVSRTATADEIKRAFRDQVKRTHPDSNISGAASRSQAMSDLVEAYRVLRDEKKRRMYDLEQANRGDFGQGPSSNARRSSGSGEAAAPSPRNVAEPYAIGVFLVSAAFIVMQMLKPQPPTKDNEQPRRMPRSASQKSISDESTAGKTKSVKAANSIQGSGFRVSGAERESSQPPDELVKAFWDPFFERWYKIPKGYEAPAGMDLTAWHNKRVDSTEWSRLFAEGKLSQIIPRGGLQVRYLPSWQTHEPILLCDPYTGKTVSGYNLAPRNEAQEKCNVQF